MESEPDIPQKCCSHGVPRLYPLLFEVHYKSVLWGGDCFEQILGREIPASLMPSGEAWEICDRPDVSSCVKNGSLQGCTLHDLLALYGEKLLGKRHKGPIKNFPVMIKWIDAAQDNSLQVHPDSRACEKIGQNTEPKSELWYVFHCAAGSRIIASWAKKCTAVQFRSLLDHPEALREYLKTYEAAPGDVFGIFPGCIHSIGKGNLIFEVQENSVTTFRITDWDRLDPNGQKRVLHVEKSMQSIDFDKSTVARTSVLSERNQLDVPYLLTAENSPFCVEEITLSGDFQDDTNAKESFQLITPLDQPVFLCCSDYETVPVPQGSTVLLGAELGKYRLCPSSASSSCRILRTFLPQ